MSDINNQELENQTKDNKKDSNNSEINKSDVNETKIEQTATNQTQEKKKKKKFKTRTKIVLTAIVLFAIIILIIGRANYINIMEIGENYLDVFTKNLKYKLYIGIINFVLIFTSICITNGLIKKGLKKFFEEEKKEMPHLPNKSLALIGGLIAAIITPNIFLEKIILFTNSSQFGIADPIFNMDVGFYMFQAPLIGLILYYFLTISIILTAYVGIYYIVVFNIYLQKAYLNFYKYITLELYK